MTTHCAFPFQALESPLELDEPSEAIRKAQLFYKTCLNVTAESGQDLQSLYQVARSILPRIHFLWVCHCTVGVHYSWSRTWDPGPSRLQAAVGLKELGAWRKLLLLPKCAMWTSCSWCTFLKTIGITLWIGWLWVKHCMIRKHLGYIMMILWLFQFNQARNFFPDSSFYEGPRAVAFKDAFSNLVISLVQLVGGDVNMVRSMVDDLWELDKAISQVGESRNQFKTDWLLSWVCFFIQIKLTLIEYRSDVRKRYNLMTVTELQELTSDKVCVMPVFCHPLLLHDIQTLCFLPRSSISASTSMNCMAGTFPCQKQLLCECQKFLQSLAKSWKTPRKGKLLMTIELEQPSGNCLWHNPLPVPVIQAKSDTSSFKETPSLGSHKARSQGK